LNHPVIARANAPELGRYPLVGGGGRPEAKDGLAGAFPLVSDSGIGKRCGEGSDGVI